MLLGAPIDGRVPILGRHMGRDGLGVYRGDISVC